MGKKTRVLASAVMMSTLICNSVFAAPDEVGNIKNKKQAVEAEVSSLQADLTAMMTKLDVLESDMITKGEQIAQANADLEAAQKKEEKQYADMKLRIKMMYENGSTTMITKIFESGSIVDMLKQAENVQTLHEYDRRKLDEYVETKEQVIGLKASLEEEMENMRTMKGEFDAQKASIASTLEEKKSEAADLEVQLQKAVEEAARKAEEERRQREAEQRRKAREQASQNRPQVSAPIYSGGNSYVSSGDASVGQSIVAAARRYIGVPYVWGGMSASGVDCSGLTSLAHRAVGISIPRNSGGQAGSGKNVGSLANALPGDIICYPGHVAVYIGGERVIHAPTEGQNVKEASVYMGSAQPITAIRRYW